MKTIMIPIQPKWVEKILNGKKTIEVRKTALKETPFKVCVYCTKGRDSLVYSKDPEDIAWCKPFIDKENNRVWITHNSKLRKYCKDREWNGKVVAEFICDRVDTITLGCRGFYIKGESTAYTNIVARNSCLYFPDLQKYFKDKDGYAWHISDLIIYDKPKELGEFYKPVINGVAEGIKRSPQNFVYVEEIKCYQSEEGK